METITNAPDARLRTISLQKLMAGDSETCAEVLAACIEVGFFYLDCNTYASGKVVKEINGLYRASEKFYDLPQEVKNEWAKDKDHGEDLPVCGYKPAGVSSGSVESKKDGFEGTMIFEHALDKASPDTPLDAPTAFAEERGLVQESVSDLHDVGLAVLAALSKSLGMSDDQGFENSHRKNEECTTALGLLKYCQYHIDPERIGHISHTDAGSLSMVFSDVGGLQVLMPETEQWTFIVPKPGHAVINVGDSLQFLSKGVLRSSLHRVVPHPDAEKKPKYTVVYLMRPESNAIFKDSDGVEWKSVEWCNKKFSVFRADLAEQQKGKFLTGRAGYTGMMQDADSRRVVAV